MASFRVGSRGVRNASMGDMPDITSSGSKRGNNVPSLAVIVNAECDINRIRFIFSKLYRQVIQRCQHPICASLHKKRTENKSAFFLPCLFPYSL